MSVRIPFELTVDAREGVCKPTRGVNGKGVIPEELFHCNLTLPLTSSLPILSFIQCCLLQPLDNDEIVLQIFIESRGFMVICGKNDE